MKPNYVGKIKAISFVISLKRKFLIMINFQLLFHF